MRAHGLALALFNLPACYVAAGWGKPDHSALLTVLEDLAGTMVATES